MRILCRFYGWLIFARVIALFMFVWPYVHSHILCTQLKSFVVCRILFIFGILIDHELSMHILYRFYGWLIFMRVIALFMFVWPYIHSHILCMQLKSFVVCRILFIFGILIGHDLSMPILYRFHGWLIFVGVIALFMFVSPYVLPHILCTQLVICLWHILFIFGILVGHDLSMLILYRFHGWLIFARVIALFMFVWPYVCPHICVRN
jgi:hypothetical protein